MKALDVAVRSLGEPRRSAHRATACTSWAAATSGAIGGAFGIAALAHRASGVDHAHPALDRRHRRGRGRGPAPPRHQARLRHRVRARQHAGQARRRDRIRLLRRARRARQRGHRGLEVPRREGLGEVRSARAGAPRGAHRLALRYRRVAEGRRADDPGAGRGRRRDDQHLFIGHYQDMARGHFIVRRLEKIHGEEPVRLAYEKL